jgi:hypothetical protein
VKEMLWAVRQYWKQGDVMKRLGGSNAQQAQSLVVSANSAGRHLHRIHHKQQQQQQDRLQAIGSTSSSRQLLASVQPGSPLMIDVGANVGWFSINAAAAGARVVAFEGICIRREHYHPLGTMSV